METGLYYGLRMFDAAAGEPELTENNFYCREYRHNEYIYLPSTMNKLLPFGMMFPGSAIGSLFDTGTVSAVFVCHETGDDFDISIASGDWIQTDTDDAVYLHNKAELAFTPTEPIPYGKYHIEMSLTLNGVVYSYYSDTFLYVPASELVEIKCRNETPLGEMIFPDGFYSTFLVSTTVERPEYPIQEDAREDQEGDTHLLFQRYDKERRLRFMGVESNTDACSLLRMMDEVYVNGTRVYDTFVDVRWEEDRECLANIEISFNLKKIIKTQF